MTRCNIEVLAILSWLLTFLGASPAFAADRFDGRFYRGAGDVEYLQLLDIARRLFEPDAEFQNLPMLYTPAWNGLVEGPTWGAWWIQNSYGTTYGALPFYREPWLTFLTHSHDLWFDQMGDGKTVRKFGRFDFVPPDGCLCDAASPGWFVAKQGDCRVELHDWAMEFTAAGVLMQAELLLISRDEAAIARYLPKLERCVSFIESRRDPKNNLFLAGPAGNLLAPSYAGWKRPDGTYDMAYLTGLSITHIAALDRLIEVEKLAGYADKAAFYEEKRDLAGEGLALLTTEEGYFIKSLDPDGVRHGVYGAKQHGYFEASPNHDAIAFRVVDDAQAERIYNKIASIPDLRPHAFIIANAPGLDDIYDKPTGLWQYGTWVNGGHWSTCEGRMMMAYYRLGKYEDARRSMRQLLTFARQFRMDNPLVKFGSDVYQPGELINLCYDTFAPAAGLVRGLFEYLYAADKLTLLPHIPPGITELEQRFPIRFGKKWLFLSTRGRGPVTAVRINGQEWKDFDARAVRLPYAHTPDTAHVQIALGGAELAPAAETTRTQPPPVVSLPHEAFWSSEWATRESRPNTLPLRIGADSNGASRFLGDIARPLVLGRALSADEIARLAKDDGGLAADAALVGAWRWDQAKDRAFDHIKVADLPARISGDVEIVDSPHGKAIRLTGQGWVEVADHARLALTKSYTLAAWVAPKALPDSGGRIIDKSTVGTSDNFLLDTHPGNSLRLITRRGSVAFDAKLPLDEWSHVAATFEAAGELRLYLDGKCVASAAAGAPSDMPGSIAALRPLLARLARFREAMAAVGLGASYEAEHARLAIEMLAAIAQRQELMAKGELALLPEPPRAAAADKSYVDALAKLCTGLEKALDSYAKAQEPSKRRAYEVWAGTATKK
ncbi:MAG TPA: hypothetical protein PKY77_02035 [Phycisphaerae bacterium]|nr:hypothetical protein [Phycisphaerae bacterium]HRY67933.1 hypothetical protein [Phycisphaerae bacterium]HSA26670.1 hypothetical protein [Phycisphaerae bacterium]